MSKKAEFTYVLLLTFADLASKFYLLDIYKLGEKGRVAIFPYLDFVLAWNKGISYSLFESDTDSGRWILATIMVALCIFVGNWLIGSNKRIEVWALIFILGGAIGNTFDRIYHGAVVDFVALYYHDFNWYVFNLADVFIVVGAIFLVFTMFFDRKHNKVKGVGG